MQKFRLLQWAACLMLIVSLVVPNVAWAHVEGEGVKVRLLGLNGMSYEAYVNVNPGTYINTSGAEVTMDKATAMSALVALAKEYNLTYKAQTTAYGVYVTEIAGLKAEQINKNTGWSAYVNGQSLSVSADQVEVHDGDVVTWAYVDFTKTLYPKVNITPETKQLGDEITVKVTADQTTYDANWNATTTTIPVEGATVFWTYGVGGGTDAIMPVTDKNGVVKIKPEYSGLITLSVYKDNENGVADLINSGENFMLVGNKNANFTDLNGYGWAKTYIDQLAAKGVVRTTGGVNVFKPAQAVTRYDLAEFLSLAGDLKIGGNATYKDLTLSPAYIQTVTRKGYMNGDAEGTFRPNANLTREEFAIVLTRFAGVEVTAESNAMELNFTDKAKVSTWAAPYVKTAVASGLMVGDAEGTFRPKATLSRAEVVTALAQVMNKQAK